MNRIRDLLHSMDWEDDVQELFDRFIEEVNELPFNTDYENTPEFLLNQSIINNAYLLRRTMELYPQEQRNPVRRSTRLRNMSSSSPISFRYARGNVAPVNTPISHRFSDDDTDIVNGYYPNRYTQQNIWNPLELNITQNFTDSIFASLFTNFNNFMEQNLNDLEDVKVTLSEEDFNKLDVIEDENLIENKQCNICLEDLTKDELKSHNLIQLKCNHIYHNMCIKEWLTKQSTKCPMCRKCCRTSPDSE